MSGFVHKLINYFKLLSEAYGLKSKIALLLYIPQAFWQTYIKHNPKGTNLMFNVILKNENGLIFCGRNFVAVHTAASFHEYPIKKLMNIEEGIFIDIGANIGKYSIFMANKLRNNGKVIAIEAEPYNFGILKKNISLNHLNNIIPLNNACFSKNKEMNFFVEKAGGGMHSLYKSIIHKKSIVVKAKKLDDILKRLKLKDKVKIIKIDVEGAEAEVIKGAIKTLKKYHPKIIFECMPENFNDIQVMLKPLKYTIKRTFGDIDYIAF